MKKIKYLKKYAIYWAVMPVLGAISFDTFAAAGTLDLGTVASTVYGTFRPVTQLITAVSYVTGLGFALGAITKFKQHKDNPTQIPIATPITLVGVAAALLFLPTVLGVTGKTLFGDSYKTAGPSGVVISGAS